MSAHAIYDEIRRLASRGFRLFPVIPRDKKPLIADWPRQATTDEKTLEGWSEKFPNCNWGLATGPASGIFVVDVDGEQGLAAIKDFAAHGYELPESPGAVGICTSPIQMASRYGTPRVG